MNIYDAIKAQPKIASEPGYKSWLESDDYDGLREALNKWGFELEGDGNITDV